METNNETQFKIQYYTVLLKSNRIFCLNLGNTFGNYFLTVSNEGDDHLCLFFVCLNYPPKKLIAKFLHGYYKVLFLLLYKLALLLSYQIELIFCLLFRPFRLLQINLMYQTENEIIWK